MTPSPKRRGRDYEQSGLSRISVQKYEKNNNRSSKYMKNKSNRKTYIFKIHHPKWHAPQLLHTANARELSLS
jgi:hypothetical protein